MKKAIAYCMTRNCYEKAVPSIRSVLANAKPDVIYLLIEDDEFPVKLPKTKVINVSDQEWFPKNGVNYYSKYSYMVMMRVALCKYLKEDRVLSLDIDTIVDGDISALWDLPLDDYYLSAGKEPHKSRPGFLAINAGVMLMNLDKMRDGKADEIIHALNTRNFAFYEQDAINEFCQGGILELPPEYNVHPWSVKTDKKPVIVHYAGTGDWSNEPLTVKYSKEVTKNGTRKKAKS